jgi:hypothetical protein
MGLFFNLLYKGGNLPAYTQRQKTKQLSPQNIEFFVSIGLKPIIEYGHIKHWCGSRL